MSGVDTQPVLLRVLGAAVLVFGAVVACAPDSTGCPGGDREPCAIDSDCAEGLSCFVDTEWPRCVPRCACPDGERCPSCDEYVVAAGGAMICEAGWCAYESYETQRGAGG